MDSLETLILSGCSNLQKFLGIIWEMKELQEIYLDETRIEELPSMTHLSKLKILSLRDCKSLTNLPSSIGGCKFLKKLILSGCSKVETLPENLRQIETLEELDLSGTAIRKPPFFIFEFKNLQVLSFSGRRGPPSKVRSNLLSLFKVPERESMDSVALILHSFSSLSSLRVLNLSWCNLGDGAIPSDISGLSSLEKLDLQGNNFTSLPANLGELSKLDDLYLYNCKKLKSLPRLLTGTKAVDINGCASLEVIEDPKIASSSQKRDYIFGAIISGFNCYKLVEKNNASTMLIKHIKIFAEAKEVLGFNVPGSEIPEWFSHQTDECTIKIPLPPNLGNDSQWMGVAHCFVLISASSVYDDWKHASNDDHSVVECSISYPSGLGGAKFLGKKHWQKRIGKGHLFLEYFPRESLYERMGSSGETDIFYYEISAEPYFKLKQGFRIVYEEDLKKMEEIKEQCSGPATENFDDR